MDSKRLKVKNALSMQIQKAINDIRWWIRVLSNQTIGHLKKMYMLYKHILALLCFAMRTSRNT